MNSNRIARTKRAELLATVGAGVIGAGVALLFAGTLAPYYIVILLVGLLAHAWGMFEKHQLDNGRSVPLWSEALYWLCWAALAVLAVVIAVRHLLAS